MFHGNIKRHTMDNMESLPRGKDGVSCVSSPLECIAIISQCIFLAILLCISN